MFWTMGILLFIMSVTTLSSSLRTGPEYFFEMGAPYGAVSENTVRSGKLLIGAQGVLSQEEMEISGLRSAEQSHEYRSNEEERFRLAKAKLRRLGPSVYCGNDSMTLRIPGSRTPHFLVDRGIESPVPLSEMPASCGFSLKRARRDVSLGAPYQGCHVRKQGGRYVLPLFIMGAPVQMSCPASPPLPIVSCSPSGMMISLGVRPDDVKVKVDGSWQPLLLAYSRCSFMLESVDGTLVVTAPFIGRCWDIKDTDMQLHLMYGDRQLTLSCPWTQPMLAPITDGPLLDPFGNQQMFPQMFPRPMLDAYHSNSGGFPGGHQRHSKYPMFHPHMHYFKNPVKAPTLPPPTTAAPLDQFMVPQRQQPKYPMFPPHMYPFENPVKATTPPTPPTAAQLDQFIDYPPRYQKYYGPKPFVRHHGQYPFMPKYPQDQAFPPHNPKPASSPVWSQTDLM